MPTNYCQKIVFFIKSLFKRKQRVKHPRHYYEKDISGGGYTFTPSFLNERFKKTK